jgi:hypothetical protein
MTIDLDTARAVLKADVEDDALVTRYLAGARGICEGFCNRKFYDTQEESDEDFLQAMSDLQEAEHARYAALDAADCNGGAKDAITNRYIQIIGDIKARINGIVVDDLIEAAILITLGFLYFNREDAVQVPQRAQRILQPKLWIGDLADGRGDGGS